MKRLLIYFFLICVIGWWGIKALFGGTFYTSHDGYTHTARIAQYVMALQDGQLPPRWAGTLNGGFGSPIFVFSYPLPYILGAGLHFLGFSFTYSFKILVAGSFLLSGLGMFFFLKELFDKRSAFVGSIFFILAPYRFLNIYVRGSLSENIAFACIPLVFFTLVKLWKTNQFLWIIVGSLALSALLLSQNLIAAMFLPLIIAMVIFLFLHNKDLVFLKHAFFTIVLGFGIAAFAYVPIFFEKKYLRFAELITYYKGHFISAFQLVRSPWGYGFSLPGTINDEMSFQIGLIHLLILGIGLLLLGVHLLKQKKFGMQTNLFIYSALFCSIAVILMIDTGFTKFLWQTIPFLKTIDLPWRFLSITVFTLSIIAAYVISHTRSKIILAILLVLVVYANRNHIHVNQYIHYPDEEFVYYRGTATWLNEYTPIWRNATSFNEVKTRYTVLDGNSVVTELISRSNQYTIETQATASGTVRLNILYFPGWRVYLDDHELMEKQGFYIASGERNKPGEREETGVIDVPISQGRHVISARFNETPIRLVGNSISFLSVAIITWLWVYKKHIAL